MQIKSVDGLVRLTETEIIMEYGAAALTEKKEVSARIIPYEHVLEIDYEVPRFTKNGYLRIVMREDQARVNSAIDTYTVQLNKAKESNPFVEYLRQRVGAVEYRTLPESNEVAQVDRTVEVSEIMGSVKIMMASGTFKGFTLAGSELKRGISSWPLAECEAYVETGAAVSARVTASRVVAGAMTFGSTGALVGAISKKDRSKVYLTITVPGDAFLEEVRGVDEGKARQFATKLNKLAAAHKGSPVGQAINALTPPPPPPSAVPAGWYPQGDVQRYWDGSAWTEHTAPLPPTQ
jgi:hypothetical protein